MTYDVNKPGKFGHSSQPQSNLWVNHTCSISSVLTETCAFGTCKNDSRYPESWKRNPNGDPVKFFHFPGAVRQSARRQKWIQACHRVDSFVCTEDSHICSLHFVGVKWGLRGLHDSYGSWHLYICRFLFGLSTFLSLHSCYEGHFVLFCKEKIEPLDRVMANFKRS